MNIRDIEKRISYTEEDRGPVVVHKAKVTFEVGISVDRYALRMAKDQGDLLKHVRDRLTYDLLRSIYDDQRKELVEGIRQLMFASPMDHKAIDAARNRILSAAQFQVSGVAEFLRETE